MSRNYKIDYTYLIWMNIKLTFFIDKALWAYSLESLIPSSTSVNTSGSGRTQARQRLSASNNIQYFNVGIIRETTFLVFMKRRGLESHFKVLEPIGTGGGQRKGMFQMRSDSWFKEYKVFFFYRTAEDFNVTRLCFLFNIIFF